MNKAIHRLLNTVNAARLTTTFLHDTGKLYPKADFNAFDFGTLWLPESARN